MYGIRFLEGEYVRVLVGNWIEYPCFDGMKNLIKVSCNEIMATEENWIFQS